MSLSLEAYRASSSAMTDSPQGGGILVSSSSGVYTLFLKFVVLFNNKDFPSTSGSIQGQQGYVVCSGSLLDRPDQQFKKELLMPGVRAFG